MRRVEAETESRDGMRRVEAKTESRDGMRRVEVNTESGNPFKFQLKGTCFN